MCAEDRAAGPHGDSPACLRRLLTVLRSGCTVYVPTSSAGGAFSPQPLQRLFLANDEHLSVCPLATWSVFFAEMPVPFADGAVCLSLLSAVSRLSVLEIKPHWSLRLQAFSL